MEQAGDKNNIPQRPATKRLVERLYADGLLTAEARREAVRIIFPPHEWGVWLYRLLLSMGTALLLAGVVFFFAYNWAALSKLAKLLMVQGGVAVCVACAVWLGQEKIGGKLFALAASLLVGVYLAVFGQIYQTGADAYTLFRGWALLILPWVILTRFTALWAMWLIVVNVFIATYWAQAIGFDSLNAAFRLLFILALFNAVALVIREILVGRRSDWLDERWFRILLSAAILTFLSIPTVIFVVNVGHVSTEIPPGPLCLLLLATALAAICFYYIQVSPDIAVLSLATLDICVIATVFFIRILFSEGGDPSPFILLLMAVIVLGIFSGGGLMIQKISRYIKGREHHEAR